MSENILEELKTIIGQSNLAPEQKNSLLEIIQKIPSAYWQSILELFSTEPESISEFYSQFLEKDSAIKKNDINTLQQLIQKDLDNLEKN